MAFEKSRLLHRTGEVISSTAGSRPKKNVDLTRRLDGSWEKRRCLMTPDVDSD